MHGFCAVLQLRGSLLCLNHWSYRLSACSPPAEAHSLQPWYSLPLELARALEVVGVNGVLAEHLLPQVCLVVTVATGQRLVWCFGLHSASKNLLQGQKCPVPVPELLWRCLFYLRS
mgnify:CR=1 FL=1